MKKHYFSIFDSGTFATDLPTYRPTDLPTYRTQTYFKLCVYLAICFLLLFDANTAQAQAPPVNCSPFTPDYYIPSGSPVLLSSLGLSGSISNKTFVVDADLIIDVSAYFTNCLFKVAPGKSIHVKALGYCVFFTSTLYSCGGRWQGIDIIDNNAFLDISFSTIQNAVAGVQISSKTSTNISIYHNDFYNNHVGIYILGNTSFASNFTFGNKFHGSMVAFKPGFTVPFQTLPAYGIRIEGVGYYALHCNVGNFFADAQIFAEPNEFYNLYVSGIYCDVAQTEVRGALFYDFFKIPDWYPFSYAPVMGVGITNYSSDLVVSNYNTDPYPPIEFRNLEYGYYAKNYQGGSWTLVEGARFSACASSAMYGSFASPSASFTALRDTFTQIRKTTHTFFTPTKKYNGIYMDGTTQIYDFSNNVFYFLRRAGTFARRPLSAIYEWTGCRRPQSSHLWHHIFKYLQ